MTPDPILGSIRDRPDWLEPGRLKEALHVFDSARFDDRMSFYEAFDHFDQKAIEYQKWHARISLGAALLAFFAIVVALVELPIEYLKYRYPETPGVPWLSCAEVFLVVLALGAVAMGLWTSTLRRWIGSRHQAERLRQLQFTFLTEPDLWAGSPESASARAAKFQDAINEARTLQMDQWIEREQEPVPPRLPSEARWDLKGLKDLSQYYRQARYWGQIRYLSSKAEHVDRLDRITYRLPQILFFGVGTLVLFRAILMAASGEGVRGSAIILLGVAIALPALGAAIRTFRLANEFDRHVQRSRVKAAALAPLAEQLRNPAGPADLFVALWTCEYILSADHREWLRLMSDAEWFG